QGGVVAHGPLRTIFRKDRHAIAGLDSQGVQAERQRLDRETEVGGRDGPPLPARLRQKQVGLSRRRGRPKDVAERARGFAHVSLRKEPASSKMQSDCVRGADILSSMAFALLLATALAVLGLLATSIQGFVLAAGLAAAGPAARALVGRHVLWAIPAVLFSLFSQSMVIFYFIGTGKLVKDEIAGYPDEVR